MLADDFEGTPFPRLPDRPERLDEPPLGLERGISIISEVLASYLTPIPPAGIERELGATRFVSKTTVSETIR